MDRAQAWMVIGSDNYKAVFLDQATAERYAALKPLFFGRRREDDRPEGAP